MPPRRRNITINHDKAASQQQVDKARQVLQNKAFNNKNTLSKEDARKLTEVAKVNDVQFDIIYEEYIRLVETLNSSIEDNRPNNYTNQSITQNGNSMHFMISDYCKNRPLDDLLSAKDFANLIRGWRTYDYDEKV